MSDPVYTVRALDESTWAAFAALVERNNGVFGGCWCMGFHPEGVGKDTTPALNRERKLERVRAGTAHAALVFDGDDCVGWCQFGAPDEVPRIKSRAAYEKGRTTSPDWRIACCYVGKGHRRKGVATAALAGAVDLIAGLGGGTVEGYPEDAGSVPAGFLFNGALSTYERLGFSRDRKIGKHRWVVTRVVEPRSLGDTSVTPPFRRRGFGRSRNGATGEAEPRLVCHPGPLARACMEIEAPGRGPRSPAGQTAAASGSCASIVLDGDVRPEISMRLGFGCSGFGTVTLRTPFS